MKHNVSLPNRKAAGKNVNFFTVNGLNKVACIKAVRGATDLGLKEAKELIETLAFETSITIDTTNCQYYLPDCLKTLRECGFRVERSLNDPITFLRNAADMALAVDNVDLAADILNVVRRHV